MHRTDRRNPIDNGRDRVERPVIGRAGGYGWGLVARCGFLLFGLTFASRAPAAEAPDARTTSIDVNRFQWDATGTGLRMTSSGEVMGYHQLRAQFAIQHLSPPLVVLDENGKVARNIVGSRQQADISLAMGVMNRVDIALRVPVVLHQRATLPGKNLGNVASAGLGDILLIPRVRLLAERQTVPFSAALSAALTLPTGNDGAWMSTGAFAAEPRLALSRQFGDRLAAANLGYKVQRETTLNNIVDGDKLTWGIGVEHSDPADRYRASLEWVGATRAAAPFQNREETTGELILGGKKRIARTFFIEGGFGVGVFTGLPTPAWRATVAISGVFDGLAPPLPVVAPPEPTPVIEPERIELKVPEEPPPEVNPAVEEAAMAPPAAPVPLPSPTPLVVLPLHFGVGSPSLRFSDIPLLRPLLVALEADPTLNIRAVGHADSTGAMVLNEWLSAERARNVRAWLVANAKQPRLLAARIQAVGMGPNEPVAPNDTLEGRAMNRRVEIFSEEGP